MNQPLPIVTRRDMLGHDCLLCEGGVYEENYLKSLLGDAVSCSQCGSVVDRWMTKREVLRIRSEKE